MAGINGVGRVGIRSYVAPTTSLSSIVTNGLVLNLDAGNATSYPGTGTTWTDLSGNGNNGTLVNGTSYSNTNGGTLVFDGIDDYVSLTNNNLPMGTSDFTWSIWFKTPNTFSGSWRMLLSTSQYYAYFASSSNGNLRLDFSGGTAGVQPLLPNTWYNMVITRVSGANGIKAYANGSFLGNLSLPADFNLSGNMNIGNWAYNNSYNWLGNISNFAIYNRAISPTEVTSNFDALKSRYGYVSNSIASNTARTIAFAAATGITDTNILDALIAFDTGLISNGLDTKMKALYPFVGGTANTHKFNFMDARDEDSAFRLAFNGGWIHNNNGVTGNGTNAFANTYLNPYLKLYMNSAHLSYYARTGSNANTVWIGNGSASGFLQNVGGTIYGGLASGYISKGGTGIDNLFTMLNRNSNYQEIRRLGSSLISVAGEASGFSSENFYLNSYNQGQYFSPSNCAFASIGDGMTDSQATTFYNLVQALQTALSRQV